MVRKMDFRVKITGHPYILAVWRKSDYLASLDFNFLTYKVKVENQDGGIGRHTAPRRTTRTDRKSNGKEVQHQGDKK